MFYTRKHTPYCKAREHLQQCRYTHIFEQTKIWIHQDLSKIIGIHVYMYIMINIINAFLQSPRTRVLTHTFYSDATMYTFCMLYIYIISYTYTIRTFLQSPRTRATINTFNSDAKNRGLDIDPVYISECMWIDVCTYIYLFMHTCVDIYLYIWRIWHSSCNQKQMRIHSNAKKDAGSTFILYM